MKKMPEKIKLKIAGKYVLIWQGAETHYCGEADYDVPILTIQFVCGTVTSAKVLKIMDTIEEGTVKIPFSYEGIRVLKTPVYS